MKALHTSLVIVVAAIVILIAALVVLSVFGIGITLIRTLTDARSFCLTQGAHTCQATDNPPLNWEAPTIRTESGMQSCGQLTTYKNCEGILGTGGRVSEIRGEGAND